MQRGANSPRSSSQAVLSPAQTSSKDRENCVGQGFSLSDNIGQTNSGHHTPTLPHSLHQSQAAAVPCPLAGASQARTPQGGEHPDSNPRSSPSAHTPEAGPSPCLGEAVCWGLASKCLLQPLRGWPGHLPPSTTQLQHLAPPLHLRARTPAPPLACSGPHITSISGDGIRLSARNAWNFLPAWSAQLSLPNSSPGLLKRSGKLSVPI